MKTLQLSSYTFQLPDDKRADFIEEKDLKGFAFYDSEYKYEVLDCILGMRLLINSYPEYAGYCRDIPFNLNTAMFLPDFIIVNKDD